MYTGASGPLGTDAVANCNSALRAGWPEILARGGNEGAAATYNDRNEPCT